ncbi:MAG: VanW family protein [Myxococcota bacterium]
MPLPFALRIGLRRLPALVRAPFVPTPPRAVPERFSHVQCVRASPLRRQGTLYGPAMQAAKEHNVRRAAELLDGVVVPPGGTFSWHRVIGPPIRARGFVPGPELHDGVLAAGGGGGACQAANLVWWLAVHGGLDVVERHRHGLDLFPDHDRSAPFGAGATVFWPHRDLRLRNPHDQAVVLEVRVGDDQLVGRLRFERDPGARWELVEEAHRFVREGEATFRENVLWRRECGSGQRTLLARNRARVAYPVEGLAPR